MRTHRTNASLLRGALRIDAVASGVMGLALVLAGGSLAALLGLPEPLLRGAGAVLLPYAAAVALVGSRTPVSRAAATGVVAVNVLWVLASAMLLLVDGMVAPTTLGSTFVVLQALAVLAFAEAQWMGLRRAARAADASPIATA